MQKSTVALTFASLIIASSALGITGCAGGSSSDDLGSPALYGSPVSTTTIYDDEDESDDVKNPESEDASTEDLGSNQND